MLRQASLQFMMSAGLTIVMLTGGIDLSVGAILGLVGLHLRLADQRGFWLSASLAALLRRHSPAGW